VVLVKLAADELGTKLECTCCKIHPVMCKWDPNTPPLLVALVAMLNHGSTPNHLYTR